MLAVVAPGQGSQRPGCLRDWLADPAGTEAVARLGVPPYLIAAGTDPQADVVDTAIAQPLIVALGLAAADRLGCWPDGSVLLGHSVGELTAAAAGGAITPAAAVRLAMVRGRAMAGAAAATPSGMAAVLGGEPSGVSAAVQRAGAVVANHNGPGQLVAAGSMESLERLAAGPPQGARVRPLPVAGAFHTDFMAAATGLFAAAVAGVTFDAARYPLLSGIDGAVVTDGAELATRLVAAVTRPVRWDRCLTAMAALGVTGCIELPPAGVLCTLVRRHLPQVEVVAVHSPADLPAARDLMRRHGPGADVDAPDDLRVLVSPAAGRWERTVAGLPTARSGEPLPLGQVRARRNHTPVILPSGGRVTEWLAADGDPVREGQPLARTAATETASGPAT